MRYATADTRFSVMEIKWGLVPDLAGTQLMRHLAREDRPRAHLHRPHLQRRRGPAVRLRDEVVDDPRAAALETARKSPTERAIRADKRLLNDAVAVGTPPA